MAPLVSNSYAPDQTSRTRLVFRLRFPVFFHCRSRRLLAGIISECHRRDCYWSRYCRGLVTVRLFVYSVGSQVQAVQGSSTRSSRSDVAKVTVGSLDPGGTRDLLELDCPSS